MAIRKAAQERHVASSGETSGCRGDAPQSRTSRRPGEASSETAASRADEQTAGRTETQTDGPIEREDRLAQRARLARANAP
jgi:hypothetical protein